MTQTFKHDLYTVKVNCHVKYLGQKFYIEDLLSGSIDGNQANCYTWTTNMVDNNKSEEPARWDLEVGKWVEWSLTGHKVMHARKWYKIHRDLVQINVQWTFKSRGTKHTKRSNPQCLCVPMQSTFLLNAALLITHKITLSILHGLKQQQDHLLVS